MSVFQILIHKMQIYSWHVLSRAAKCVCQAFANISQVETKKEIFADVFFSNRLNGWKKSIILLLNLMLCDILICIASILNCVGFTQRITLYEKYEAAATPPTAEQQSIVQRWGCVGTVADSYVNY